MRRRLHLNDQLTESDMAVVNRILASHHIAARPPSNVIELLDSLLPMSTRPFVAINNAISAALEDMPDANATNANVQSPDAPGDALPPAPPNLERQPGAGTEGIDALAALDHALDATAPHAHLCRPLPRKVIAAAAADIRRLRIAIMAIPDQDGR